MTAVVDAFDLAADPADTAAVLSELLSLIKLRHPDHGGGPVERFSELREAIRFVRQVRDGTLPQILPGQVLRSALRDTGIARAQVEIQASFVRREARDEIHRRSRPLRVTSAAVSGFISAVIIFRDELVRVGFPEPHRGAWLMGLGVAMTLWAVLRLQERVANARLLELMDPETQKRALMEVATGGAPFGVTQVENALSRHLLGNVDGVAFSPLTRSMTRMPLESVRTAADIAIQIAEAHGWIEREPTAPFVEPLFRLAVTSTPPP